jgi:putative SOS response-associated peptidase YedK
MYTWEELIRLYRLTVPNIPSNLQPRYNICLTTTIDAVVEKEGKRALEPMRCGLVPAWWNIRLYAIEVRRQLLLSYSAIE